MLKRLAIPFTISFVMVLVVVALAADLFKRHDAYSYPKITAGIVRSFNTAYQISSTQFSEAAYTVQISASITLTAGQTGTIYLETSPDNATWTEMGRFSNGNTGALTIGLSLVQSVTDQLQCMVPPGYYVRLRSTGTATNTYITGQEVIWN